MSLFDEQIRTRKKNDQKVYEQAFARMAAVLMGQKAELDGYDISVQSAVNEILRYFRIRPQQIPEDMQDFNEQIEYLMRPSGIMHRRVYLSKGWHSKASGPMLGFLKDGEVPVALLPDYITGYVYIDSSGERHRITTKTEQLLMEEGLLFYRPLPLHPISMKDVIRFDFQVHHMSDRIFFLLFLGIATFIQFLVPRVTRLIFSQVIYSESMTLFWTVTVFLISLSVSQAVFTMLRQLALEKINNRCAPAFEAAVVMRLMILPASFFHKENPGMICNRVYNSPRLLPSNLNNLIYSTIFTTIFSMVYVIQIVQYAPGIASAAIITLVLQILVYVLASVFGIRITKKQLDLHARDSGMSFNIISGIQKIKLAGAEKRIFSRWAEGYARSASLQYKPPVALTLAPAIAAGIGLAGQIVIYAGGISSGVNTAEYFSFTAAYGLAQAAVLSLSTLTQTIAQISPLYDMLRPILEAVPETSEMRRVVSRLSGQIELNDVSFRYEKNGPNIVDHLSLKIKPGEYLAIVGKTGCGKSTLLRLLLGFETPDSGQITYDGRDLSGLDLRSLRHSIGVVLQDGKLFQGDIYSNIVISAPWLTEEQAWEAAKLAGLADDIRHMPMGMHTMINANGGGVSGGQRQRILIARAIASRPAVLMLDEATSALDNVIQKMVSDSLASLGSTRIVIAHRLSTIRQCDRIIMLDQGHVIESGTYEELMAQNGVFADMVRRQQVSYNQEE